MNLEWLQFHINNLEDIHYLILKLLKLWLSAQGDMVVRAGTEVQIQI
jgi:hypothetical protein